MSSWPRRSPQSKDNRGSSHAVAWISAAAALIGSATGLALVLQQPARIGANIEVIRVEPGVTLAAWTSLGPNEVPEYWHVALEGPVAIETPPPPSNLSSSVGDSSSTTRGSQDIAPQEEAPDPPPAAADGEGANAAPPDIAIAGSLPADLEEIPGVIVSFRMTVEGFSGRSVPLTWTLFDAKTGKRLGPETSEVEVGDFRIEADADQYFGELWLPIPPNGTRTFVVRLEVSDDRGIGLTGAESEPFTGD